MENYLILDMSLEYADDQQTKYKSVHFDFTPAMLSESSFDVFDATANVYTPSVGDKLYFMPGVNIPRIKLKDLLFQYNIKTVRDVSDATHVFAGPNTTSKITETIWMYSIDTTVFRKFLEVLVSQGVLEEYRCDTLISTLDNNPDSKILGNYSINRNMYDSDTVYYNDMLETITTSGGNNYRNSYSKGYIKLDSAYANIYDIAITKNVLSEAAIISILNGADAVVITPEIFDQLSQMFNSSDEDNHVLAMEIMANSCYKESLLYLEILFKEHSGRMSGCHSKNHVNFKSLLSYLGKHSRYMSTGLDDVVSALITKKVLTVDMLNILMDRYSSEIVHRGDSTFFRVKTITADEETLALINNNFVYKIKDDFIPVEKEELVEEILDKVSESAEFTWM